MCFCSHFKAFCFDFGFQWHCLKWVIAQKQPKKMACVHLFSASFIGLHVKLLARVLCCIAQVCERGQKQGGIKAMCKHLASGYVTYQGDESLPLVTPSNGHFAKLRALACVSSNAKLPKEVRQMQGCCHFWRVDRKDVHILGEGIFCTI